MVVLKNAGLIRSDRVGQWVVYSLAEPSGTLQQAQIEIVQSCLLNMEGFCEDLQRYDRLAERGELVECRLERGAVRYSEDHPRRVKLNT